MYNIKQAAARAGVSVPVLRAWERRYGIVAPSRTAAGYRQFDDDAVARVRSMRTLVEAGWSPSAAAAAIRAGTEPVRDELEPAASPQPQGGEAPAEAAALVTRFVDAARSLQPESLAGVLDDLFARGSFERVAADLLFPALEALGDAWAAGSVSVAGEHMASAAVERRLGLAFEAARLAGAPGERVLVGLPPGGRHVLGALAFAVAASRAGLAVTYLGPDLPMADWLAAARGAAAAVIGVVIPRDRAAAARIAEGLRAADPRLVIAVGGRAAPDQPGLLRLPARLGDAVATLRAELQRGG